MTTRREPALLSDLARQHAGERPDAPAIVDIERLWSWAELDRHADAIAARLEAIASVPERRVGLTLGATALGVAALHGAARAGVATILVHPRLTPAEMAGLLGAARADALAVDPATGIATVPGIEVVGLDDVTDGTPDRASATATTESAFVVPTSGTTARPKLARLPLDRLAASAAAWSQILPPATGWLLSLGLAHVAGVGIVVRAGAAGVPVVVAADSGPTALLAAIEGARRHGVVVSHASFVAAQLAAILDATADAAPPDGLRAVILGGGPTPAVLVRRALAAGWPVIPSYGLTETASGVVALPVDEVVEGAATVGQALPGVALRVADDGEILVRGPMVFAGYLDDPDATATALTGDGWLRTGDLGRLDRGGRLIVDGRRDDVIMSGGEKVSPGEVEAALAAFPGIREIAVVGAPDPAWGQVPVAVIVPDPGTSVSDDDLRDFARDRLARFKVPARIVRVRELPRTSIGKVARAQLRRLAEGTERRTTVTTDDGQVLAVRELGSASASPVVLLHATLSTAAQLMPLARRLAADARVVVIDRRGSGDSAMARPGPVPVDRHVADVVAVLDALGIGAATLVGHSFGGVVAIETAVHHRDHVTGILVWEPPFLPVAPVPVQDGMAAIGDAVAAAFATGGAEAAARLFFEAVSGAGAWDRLHPRQRGAIARAGAGALADVAMGGLTPDGLERIDRPTLILTGHASEPFYRPIADELAARIGAAATRLDLPDMRHMAPITDPDPIADLVRRQLAGIPDQETSA